VGVVLSWAMARTAALFLFGLSPHDGPTMLVAIVLLASTAGLAGYVPGDGRRSSIRRTRCGV